MGIIDWKQNKTNEYRLAQADRLYMSGDVDGAREIYESLIENMSEAPLRLARMLTHSASTPSQLIEALAIVQNNQDYVDDIKLSDYSSIVNELITKIESTAALSFASKRYDDAIDLITNVNRVYSNNKYLEAINRYKAYAAATRPSRNLTEQKRNDTETISHLKAMQYYPISDINEILHIHEGNKQYSRCLDIVYNLQNDSPVMENLLVYYLTQILDEKDKDLGRIERLSDLGFDADTTGKIAHQLANMAEQMALRADYQSAIRYDYYASEYLQYDNTFMMAYCRHLIEYYISIDDFDKLRSTLNYALSQNFTESQINQLIDKVKDVADKANAVQAIEICRMFANDAYFNRLFLSKALEALRSGTKIEAYEIRERIHALADTDNEADLMAEYVNYVPELEYEFLESAIWNISESKSIDKLLKYWDIKPDEQYFLQLIQNSNPFDLKVARYISENGYKFLYRDDYINAYCSSIEKLNDDETILSLYERLIGDGLDLEDNYTQYIINIAGNAPSTDDSLKIIDRGTQYTDNKRLIDALKYHISRLASEGRIQEAENQLKNIIDKDDEAPSMLCEIYLHNAKTCNDEAESISWIKKALDIKSRYHLNSKLDDDIDDAISNLSASARRLYSKDKKTEAYELADVIMASPKHWVSLYIWLRDMEKNPASDLQSLVAYDCETINQIIRVYPDVTHVKSEPYLALWETYISNFLMLVRSYPTDTAIDSLNRLRESLMLSCPLDYANDRGRAISQIIAKQRWQQAITAEKNEDYQAAIEIYDQIHDEDTSQSMQAEQRSLICKLKDGRIDPSFDVRIINALRYETSKDLRTDLAYRYACYLLRADRPEEALNIIDIYLPAENDLRDKCKQLRQWSLQQKVEELNQWIEKLSSGELSVDESQWLGTEIENKKASIIETYPELSDDIDRIASYIVGYNEKRLYLGENQDELLFMLLDRYPEFYADCDRQREVATAALNLVDSDVENESILKYAISLSLVAIYNDYVMVRCLQLTDWNRRYSFTLADSLGRTCADDYNVLPDNVNFNAAIEDINISLGDVQKALLTHLEIAIREKHPALEEFLVSEKSALDNLKNQQIRSTYYLTTPYLVTRMPYNNSLENAIASEINQNGDNKEELLALGHTFGFHSDIYDHYNQANALLTACIQRLNDDNTPDIDQNSIISIKAYDGLFSLLKSAIQTAMHQDINTKLNLLDFVYKYKELCRIVDDSVIYHAYTQHIINTAALHVHEGSLEINDVLPLLVEIYYTDKDNVQLRNVIANMLIDLVYKAERSNSSADRQLLQQTLRDLNGQFDGIVALPLLIAKIANDSIESYQALNKLYDIYIKDMDNPNVCESLVNMILTCVSKYYFNDDPQGRSQVATVFDLLRNNRSATFIDKSALLIEQYNKEMLSRTDDQRQLLVYGYSSSGTTLNEKGKIYKAGLDYLKALGEY